MNLFKSDRNFNDEVIEQQNYYVVEHNDLIKLAHTDLTAKELKIIDFVISKIKPDDTKFNVVETSLYELNKALNLNVRSGGAYNDMAKKLDQLAGKRVYIYKENINDKKALIITHWLNDITIEEHGQVTIQLSDKLMPYLLQLKSNYTQYFLSDTAQLSSKYSIKLYKLLREADKSKGKRTPVIKVSPDELKKMLDAPESYTFGQLNQKVIQPAIDELNLKIDDMDVSMSQGKKGRKVIYLEIYNNYYPRPKPKESVTKPVPMTNWLDEDPIEYGLE